MNAVQAAKGRGSRRAHRDDGHSFAVCDLPHLPGEPASLPTGVKAILTSFASPTTVLS